MSPWERRERGGLYYTRNNPPEHPHNTSRTPETGEDYLARWIGRSKRKGDCMTETQELQIGCLRTRAAAALGGSVAEFEVLPIEEEVEDQLSRQRFMVDRIMSPPARLRSRQNFSRGRG